jgi:hypothetical protein
MASQEPSVVSVMGMNENELLESDANNNADSKRKQCKAHHLLNNKTKSKRTCVFFYHHNFKIRF